MERFLCYAFITCCVIFSCNNPSSTVESKNQTNKNADSTWALIPFAKVDSANPVLVPSNGLFICPIRREKLLWEEKDVFNPAIVVKDGKIYMLYRAQDKTSKPDGTSRIGSVSYTHLTLPTNREV